MAFKKTLAERIFSISKISTQTLTNCRISSPSVQARINPKQRKNTIAPEPGDNGIFRRFLHKRAIFQPAISPELSWLPIGGNLTEKLREFDISRDRIRLDGLSPPAEMPSQTEGLTVEDARKLLRVAQLEMLKTRLREIEKGWIPYSDFVRICGEDGSDLEQGSQIANMLDQSGTVIVLGSVVFLRPEQVAKAIAGIIPLPGAHQKEDTSRKELEQLENQKAAIDKKADTLVRRELWCGLGFLVVQTAGFMRLTFWDLSWDVMEPICFYVTSMYFMAGYSFFLRTSKEPSFEGFYQSRFIAKQKRLMKIHNFDIKKYNQLRNAFYPYSPPSSEQASSSANPFHYSEKMNFGAHH